VADLAETVADLLREGWPTSPKYARNVGSQLDPAFLGILKDLNNTIYRQSKHTIEHLDIDAHDYSPADAIGIYIVCRWAGYMLLKPTGIFSDWQKKK
jgi:hypothetical protein